MNINFIGKEFEKLAEVDNYINYEFEPKTSIKYGRRNIYFDEIKQEFINDINIYGFSPYILQSFAEQRDNPNINKFFKKFNYGYTNYIKIRTKNVLPFSTRFRKKKIKFKNKVDEKKEAIKLIPDIFLIKKEKYESVKLEQKGNFLKKALDGMGGYKLNINQEEKVKKKDNKNSNKKDNTVGNININLLKRRKGKNNIQLIKDILIINDKKEKNKTLSFNNIDLFGNQNQNNTRIKVKNIKQFFDNVQKNLNPNQSEKNVLTLTKNKYILGNKRLLSSISRRSIHSVETASSHRKKKYIRKVNSVEIPKQLIKENKKKFLLFTKAIPYKYLGYNTHK